MAKGRLLLVLTSKSNVFLQCIIGTSDTMHGANSKGEAKRINTLQLFSDNCNNLTCDTSLLAT